MKHQMRLIPSHSLFSIPTNICIEHNKMIISSSKLFYSLFDSLFHKNLLFIRYHGFISLLQCLTKSRTSTAYVIE